MTVITKKPTTYVPRPVGWVLSPEEWSQVQREQIWFMRDNRERRHPVTCRLCGTIITKAQQRHVFKLHSEEPHFTICEGFIHSSCVAERRSS